MAADRGIVAGHPRRLRHLPQYVGLSIDRDADGAATAAVEGAERREQRRQSADAGQRVRRPSWRHHQYLRGRSGLPRRLCRELAGVAAARPARVADRVDDVPGHQGQPPDAAIRAQHVPVRRGESLPDLSVGVCLSHVERPLHAPCRPVPASASAPQRTDGDGPVHVVESDGRCRSVQCRERSADSGVGSQPRGRHHRAGLARSWRGVGAVELRSASSRDRAVSVHDRRRRDGRRVAHRPHGNAVQRVDVDEPAHGGQRPAADADGPDPDCRNRRDRHDPRRSDRRVDARARGLLREPGGLRCASSRAGGEARDATRSPAPRSSV